VSKITYPVTVDTLGKLIDHGMVAFLSCPTCQGAADIDLGKLAERVGREWCFVNRSWPIRCAACGELNVEVRITPKPP
jgi:hypothetical protein